MFLRCEQLGCDCLNGRRKSAIYTSSRNMTCFQRHRAVTAQSCSSSDIQSSMTNNDIKHRVLCAWVRHLNSLKVALCRSCTNHFKIRRSRIEGEHKTIHSGCNTIVQLPGPSKTLYEAEWRRVTSVHHLESRTVKAAQCFTGRKMTVAMIERTVTILQVVAES
jgi:hypothetical protein